MRNWLSLIILALVGIQSFAQESVNDTLALSEVIIKTKKAVYWENDTISYVADSFMNSSDYSTEDLLRKLPGIEVDPNGLISVQGMPIGKVLINGSEVSVSDIRSITQNLPAEIIDKLKVINFYSKENRILGLKDGPYQKVIDISIKKKYNHSLYGRAVLGTGTKNIYNQNLFLNYLKSNARLTVTGYRNNNNNPDINSGSVESNNTLYQGNVGIETKGALTTNYFIQTSKKFTIDGTFELAKNENILMQSQKLNTYLPGDSIRFQKDMLNSLTQTENLSFNTNVNWQINSKAYLTSTVNISSNLFQPLSKVQITITANWYKYEFYRIYNNATEMRTHDFSVSSILERKFGNEGRIMLFKFDGQYRPIHSINSVESAGHRSDDSDFNYTNFQTTQYQSFLSNALSISYTTPIGKHLKATLDYTGMFQNSQDQKSVYNISTVLSQKDTTQSANQVYQVFEQNLQLRTQYSLNKIKATGGLKVQPIIRQGYLRDIQILDKFITSLPFLNFSIDISKRAKLELSYTTNMRLPTLAQIQPVIDYRDSLNQYIGSPDLKPERTSYYLISYNYLNPFRRRTFFTTFRYSHTADKIVESTNITVGKKIVRPINTNNANSVGLSTHYSTKFIGALNANVSMSASWTSYPTINNFEEQAINNLSFQPKIGINYNVSRVDVALNYRYVFIRSSATNSLFTNSFKAHSAILNSKIKLPYKIDLAFDVNIIMNIVADYQSNQMVFALFNISVQKEFDRPHGLYLRIQGYDLLNSFPNRKYQSANNEFQETVYNSLSRYFLFSIIYKFNKTMQGR